MPPTAESKFTRINSEGQANDAAAARNRRSPGTREPVHSLAIRCEFCPNSSFRRSRLRSRDLKELFRFRYPVRCLRCSQRQLVSFTIAALSLSSYVKHTRPTKMGEVWVNAGGSRARQGAGKPPVSAAEPIRRDESAG